MNWQRVIEISIAILIVEVLRIAMVHHWRKRARSA